MSSIVCDDDDDDDETYMHTYTYINTYIHTLHTHHHPSNVPALLCICHHTSISSPRHTYITYIYLLTYYLHTYSKYVCEYLAKGQSQGGGGLRKGKKVSWGVAGRNAEKLQVCR